MIAAAAWAIPVTAMLTALLCCARHHAIGAAWAMTAGFGTAAPNIAIHGAVVAAAVVAVLALTAAGFALIEQNTKLRRNRTGGVQ